jgi:chromate reductase, NAD(P)H dehydrogenase (quinone)
MKNALDWLVGSVDVVDKAVGSINASPRATEAQASLLRTLETISARLVREACVTLPWIGKRLDEEGLVADPEIAPVIRKAVLALAREARA